jgi:AraC-like DNA-binding protein
MDHRTQTSKHHQALYEDAIGLIPPRCTDRDLSVDDVAEAIFTSSRTLQRVFQERETTFTNELQMARLRLGMELLSRPLPIAAIAVGVGFRGHNRFSEAFRQLYNLSPREARRAMALASKQAWRRRQKPAKPGSALHKGRLNASRAELRRLRPLLRRLDLDACTPGQRARFTNGVVLHKREIEDVEVDTAQAAHDMTAKVA